jgi:hypothetical protein
MQCNFAQNDPRFSNVHYSLNLNPGMEAKEWGQGNECQNLAGRITPTHRRAIASKNEVILSAVLRGRRRGGTESKDPVSPGKIIKQDRTSFRHSTGFFGCAMPATCARRASLRLRMTPFF